METIILISVLSTLGVVALVTAIVVMFTKLNKKVGNEMFNNEMTGLINLIDENQRLNNKRDEENNNDLHRSIDEVYREINKRSEENNSNLTLNVDDIFRILRTLESNLDSRADKLHDLIKLTEKELVNQLDCRLSEHEKVNKGLLTN
jgi:predicted PurR-regulated permease PerM